MRTKHSQSKPADSGITAAGAQEATSPPTTAFVSSGTRTTVDLVYTIENTIPGMNTEHVEAFQVLKVWPPTPPPAAASSVVADECATMRSALRKRKISWSQETRRPKVVAKVDAGLKARKPTRSKNVPKRSCTGWRHLRNGMKTFLSAGS